MSAQTELARAVLQMLSAGQAVPTHLAIQLRNWAVCSEDSLLPLEEIAWHILARSGTMADAPQVGDWRRAGAEFIIADLELAFTFHEVKRIGAALSAAGSIDGDDLKMDLPHLALLRDLDLLADGGLPLPGFQQRGPQGHNQVFAGHFQETVSRFSGGNLKVSPGVAAHMNDVQCVFSLVSGNE